MTVYRLEQLFPSELEDRLKACPMLVLSFGTIEWHSHHLPLGFDGIVAQSIGERIADACDAVLAPVSYWAAGGVPYPYTLKLSIEIVEPLLTAVFIQFAEMGFRVISAYTGHFGIEQTLTIKRAALAAMQVAPVTVIPITAYDFVTDFYKGDHAAKGETAMMQSLYPDRVRLNAVPADEPLDGVLGDDPRKASMDGDVLLDQIVGRSAEVSLRMLNQTSPVKRAAYTDALQSGVKVLKKTYEQRQVLPKSLVPSITTPAYVAYCQAIYAGDYATAKAHAERKLADLNA